MIYGPEEAEAVLLAYVPTAHVQGYPPGPHFAAKQQRLLDDVRREYEDLVVDLLDKVESFAEKIA